MKVGDLVMLIGREEGMPPCGTIGEIVGPLDRGDFDVFFPSYPCDVGDPWWCVPPHWLMKIGDAPPSVVWSTHSWDQFEWHAVAETPQ